MSLYSDLNEVLTPYAQRIKGLKADLGVTTEDLFASKENVEYLNDNFRVGVISTNGYYIRTGNEYRICTTKHLCYDRDITLKCKDGFSYAYNIYHNGEYYSGNRWITSDKTISANTEFSVCIQRSIPDTTEIADIALFRTALTINTILDGVKSEVDGIKSEVERGIDYSLYGVVNQSEKYINGSYIALNGGIGNTVDITPIASNTREHIILPCKAGDTFVLTAKGGNAPRAWGLTDSAYKLLSVAGQDVNVSNLTVIASEDGYFISNNNTTGACSLTATQLIKAVSQITVETMIDKASNNAGADSPYNHGKFDLYPSDYCEWYSGLQTSYIAEGFGDSTSYAETISAFDGLLALDSAYITKNLLGDASGTTQGQPYKMYEYVFSPKKVTITPDSRKFPKIYIDGSIHGFEKTSTFGLFYFLKDLTTNWDKNASLAAIRANVEIHVIPVCNPWGFDLRQYKNANSVNINRNFDHPGEWEVISSGTNANGLEPFDQPESAIMRDWLLAGESDLIAYLNGHTNGYEYTIGYDEMNQNIVSLDRNDKFYNRIFRVLGNHIKTQTLRWATMYPTITPSNQETCGKIGQQATGTLTKGTASAWANTMRNMVSMTLEGFNGLKDAENNIVIESFSGDAFKINSENIGNMIIQILKEYSQ